ncbi:MAG TPA: vWA domain-containing protein, partial [Candidatus Xenobia bacterium]
RLNQIVVLTDGICSDEADCIRKSRELNEGGISISALGLGDRDRVNLNFLTQLTQVGGGRCYHRVDLSHIPEILAQELRAIKAIYATNVELYLRVVGDFQPVRSFRVGPFISDLGRIPSDTAEICLPLSDLQLHDSQDILIELTTRPNPSHTTDVLAASVKTDFPSEEVLNWSFTEMVSVPNSRQSFASLSDPTVMSMVKLVKAFDSSGLGVG